jgi:uncharacterized secreted protein with C-terminal beta-propeller domain
MKQWILPAVVAFSLLASMGAVWAGAESVGIWMALILPTSGLLLAERWPRAAGPWFFVSFLIALITVSSVTPVITGLGLMSSKDSDSQFLCADGLKKFSSYEELENFVKSNTSYYANYYCTYGGQLFEDISLPPASAPINLLRGSPVAESNSDFGYQIGDGTINISTDHSTTNIQVEGVDEADIVKTDGKYLYVVSGSKVIIIQAYPVEEAKIVSEITENGGPLELFVNGNKLVVIGASFVNVYDVENRETPVLKREVSFGGYYGYYFNSRMIGGFVYVIVNSPTICVWENWICLPIISSNGSSRTVQAADVYYFENIYSDSYQFTTIMAIDTQNDETDVKSETILMSTAQNIFVSSNNIYITYTDSQYWCSYQRGNETEKTIIHRISIAGGEIRYDAMGEVPGQVLNQFSMDEYNGYFRIATTTGDYGTNHVYVLNEDLDIVGSLDGVAPGERIYSARFMGNRAYLVTFKCIDPLFVIDLADPTNPRVLGELEIPGYSDYLHPYDETHVIGIGRDVDESIDADRVHSNNAVYYTAVLGIKIALFDVSDPQNPREISKCVVGQRGTESLALQDHKAFLFSRAKNLLVMPIGDYYRQDAYVFHISVENGIVLNGTVTHQENNAEPEDDYCWYSCWRYDSNRSVKRSLYIDNVLYTISDGLVKINNLADLSEVGEVNLVQ